MGKSGLLRAQDVRALLRLLGELRELPNDLELRRRHLAMRMCDVFRAKLGVVADGRGMRFGKPEPFAGFVAAGALDEKEWQFCDIYVREGHASDPVIKRAERFQGRVFAWRRGELVEDRAWYGSEHYNEIRQYGGVDDIIHSQRPMGPERQCDGGIAVHRAIGDTPFSKRERMMVELLLGELGFLFPEVPLESRLPPRLKRTLNGLLGGLSEKQIAYQCRLSRHTVHGYVKELYRQLGVSSRGELMARFVRGNAEDGPRKGS